MKPGLLCLFWVIVASALACSHMQPKRQLCGGNPCSSLLYRLASLEQQTVPEATKLRGQLQEACDQGIADGCVHLSVAKFFGFGGSSETTKAQENLLSECQKKTELACWWSYRLAQSQIRDADGKQLLALVRDNCANGHLESCMLHGGAYLDGFGVPINHKKARSQLQEVCEKGDQTGCLGYALCLELGMGVKQNSLRARQLADIACKKGIADACSMLGALWQDGRGGPKSNLRAKEFYKKGCDGYSLLGCYNLAAILMKVKESRYRDQARHYYGFSCRLGDGQACNDYANLLLDDRKPDSDRMARALFQSACDKGVMKACRNLAVMVERGLGGAKDIRQAKKLYRMACKGGLRNACRIAKHRSDKPIRGKKQ